MKKIILTLLLAGSCWLGAAAQQIAVKTNVLYWMATTPNLGAEGDRRSMVVDGFTYMNDVLMEEGGKFLLEDSFYDEGRASSLEWLQGFSGTKVLKGREIPKEEVLSAGETLLWDREYSGAFHDPLANAFLEFYIPEIAG